MTGEVLARVVENLVRTQERLMSRFDALSPVAELNRRAALEPVTPPAPLWEILHACQAHWRRTKGAFDIAQTARTELWRECSARGETPSPTACATAERESGFHQVQFDTYARTVRFETPGVQLDLGGIGKGLALEKVEQELRRQGVTRAFLSFGESSIAVIGTHPSGPCWLVGIADLFQPGRFLHCFELRDAAMSTSGNRTAGGHIINPRSGQLVSGHRTLSVTSPGAVEAEVLSTALLAVPVAERAAVLENYPETKAVEIGYESSGSDWTARVNWQHES